MFFGMKISFWMSFCLIIENTVTALFNLWSAIHSSLFSNIKCSSVAGPIFWFYISQSNFLSLKQTLNFFNLGINWHMDFVCLTMLHKHVHMLECLKVEKKICTKVIERKIKVLQWNLSSIHSI